MKKILIGLVVAAAVAAFLLLNNVNSLVKKGVESVGPKILQAPVTLKDCDISLFSGSGSLGGLTIGNPEGFSSEYAFALDKIAIALDVTSVTSDTVRIKSIEIVAPKIIYDGDNLKTLADNAASFSSSGEDEAASDGETDAGGAGKKVVIDYLKLAGATVKVVLPKALAGRELSVTIPTIELRDIGKDKKATVADVLNLVLARVNSSVIPAAQKGISRLGADLEGSAREAEEKAKGVLNRFKGMFGN